MSAALDQLIAHLRLQPDGVDVWVGPSHDLGWGTIFGGQVLAQSLAAAALSCPSNRLAHSLQALFLRPGDVSQPVRYEVDRQRDGRSYSARAVRALQADRLIYSALVSLAVPEQGVEHAAPARGDLPLPEDLPDERSLIRRLADRLPGPFLERLAAERAIETRLTDPIDPFRPPLRPPRNAVWYRSTGEVPEAPALHQQLLAYLSDFHYIGTALRPHQRTWLHRDMQVTSLSHQLCFHRAPRVDQWLIHEMESPAASMGRGLVTGRIYDLQGRLVASTSQEGLMRDRGGSGPS